MHRFYESKEIVEDYSKYRPHYSQDIAGNIMEYTKRENYEINGNKNLNLMLDVGCGGGQSTEIFLSYFNEILAIDPSQNQIKTAIQNNVMENIKFQVGVAEEIPVSSKSVDLIVTGEAIQWFNLQDFFIEVDRVLKPNGCLAIFGYWTPELQPFLGDNKPTFCETSSKLLSDYALEAARLTNRYEQSIPYLNQFKNIFDLIPYHNKKRIDSIKLEIQSNFNNLLGFIRSIDGFDCFPYLINDFESKVKKLWNLENKPNNEILLNMKFNYFILLATKNK